MPRGRKVRRIDYNKTEMMELSGIKTAPTFNNYMEKFYDLYGFEKSDFRVGKSENADYYFPADFADLLALILRNSSKHPFSRANNDDKNVNASQIQKYNQRMCESIDIDLPSKFRDLIYTMPSHLQSVMLGDLTSVLVERLTLFIVNITKLDHQGMGDTVVWLCKELDKANYYLFRGNYITKIVQESNEAYNNEHFKDPLDKLYGPKDEKVDDIEKRIVATNNGIDYTISLLVKRILHDTYELYHAEKGFEYLDLENKELLLMLGLEAVPADESNSSDRHSPLIERTLYYNNEISKAVNQGRVDIAKSVLPRFYVSTSKSILKALINMRSFEIQLSPIG